MIGVGKDLIPLYNVCCWICWVYSFGVAKVEQINEYMLSLFFGLKKCKGSKIATCVVFEGPRKDTVKVQL